MLKLLTISLAFLLMASTASAADPDEEAVRLTVSRFAEAWNRHDMDGFGALFAPDADFVNVTGQWWKGRQDIQRRHAFLHGTIPTEGVPEALPRNHGIFKESTYQFDRIDVRFISKDVAIAHGAWTMRADARTAEPRHGLMTFTLTRDDDHWLFSAAQNTEIERRVR